MEWENLAEENMPLVDAHRILKHVLQMKSVLEPAVVANINLAVVNPNINILLQTALIRVQFQAAHVAENIITVCAHPVFQQEVTDARNTIRHLAVLYVKSQNRTTAIKEQKYKRLMAV